MLTGDYRTELHGPIRPVMDRLRTLVASSVIDGRPELFARVLARSGIADAAGRERRVEIQEHPSEELPPLIDWQDMFGSFCQQSDNLFTFLSGVRVEGRLLTEEEVIDGFCAILTNEDWTSTWSNRRYDVRVSDGWEYAVVMPITSVSR